MALFLEEDINIDNLPEVAKQDFWLAFNWLSSNHHPFLSQLAFDYKKVNDNYKRIIPTYERLYRTWFVRVFFMPYDMEIEGRILVRCNECRSVFFKDRRDIIERKHIGHKYKPVQELSLFETILLKAGWVK